MKIAFLDLKRQYKSIKKEIDTAVKGVIDRQYFILGEELKNFESEFSEYLKVKYTVGVNSGTDGLILALRALGIGKGDEVITQTNSFIATTLAITELGAAPVLVDVNPDDYQIDINQVKKAITKKTKAILPVHLYGNLCDIHELKKIAKTNGIFLVEDACQSHGSFVGKKMTGSFGDIAVFSFYPGKNLGAYGDGGAVVTNSSKIYEKLLKLRNYGQTIKYHHDTLGVNSRLDEIQAAILRVKLKHLNKWNKQRNQIAMQYRRLIKGYSFQDIRPGNTSNYHIFNILCDQREKLMVYLSQMGIGTLIHYPIPIHMQKCYEYLGYKEGDFPVSENLAKKEISLPMYPELKKQEIEYIAKKINEFGKK